MADHFRFLSSIFWKNRQKSDSAASGEKVTLKWGQFMGSSEVGPGRACSGALIE